MTGLVGTEVCGLLAERRVPFYAPSCTDVDIRVATFGGLVLNCAAMNAKADPQAHEELRS